MCMCVKMSAGAGTLGRGQAATGTRLSPRGTSSGSWQRGQKWHPSTALPERYWQRERVAQAAALSRSGTSPSSAWAAPAPGSGSAGTASAAGAALSRASGGTRRGRVRPCQRGGSAGSGRKQSGVLGTPRQADQLPLARRDGWNGRGEQLQGLGQPPGAPTSLPAARRSSARAAQAGHSAGLPGRNQVPEQLGSPALCPCRANEAALLHEAETPSATAHPEPAPGASGSADCLLLVPPLLSLLLSGQISRVSVVPTQHCCLSPYTTFLDLSLREELGCTGPQHAWHA